MTKEQYQAEIKYRLSMHILKNLLKDGLLTKSEYSKIDTKLNKKWRPLLSGL
ncbi:MAG: hypothetical protein M0R40_05350 [Firmicutes bacterium]|nr:hypothetical protein [Bacillota bacterium]